MDGRHRVAYAPTAPRPSPPRKIDEEGALCGERCETGKVFWFFFSKKNALACFAVPAGYVSAGAVWASGGAP